MQNTQATHRKSGDGEGKPFAEHIAELGYKLATILSKLLESVRMRRIRQFNSESRPFETLVRLVRLSLFR